VTVLATPGTDAEFLSSVSLALQRTAGRAAVIQLAGAERPGDPLPVPVMAAIDASDLVIDCTDLTPKTGDRPVLYLGPTPPSSSRQLFAHAGLHQRAAAGRDLLREASSVVVTTPGGTDVTVDIDDASVTADGGIPERDAPHAAWPGGHIRIVPGSGSVEGSIVLMPGDANFSVGAYIMSPVVLTIEDNLICEIEGETGDADAIRAYLESFDDENMFGLAALTIGLNAALRPTGQYDQGHLHSATARVAAGLVTVEFGNNPGSERPAKGNRSVDTLSLGLGGATVRVDDVTVVRKGTLADALAPDVYESAAARR